MAKIQIKNSFITSSAQITVSSSLVRFSDNIRAKGITGSFSGSFAGSNVYVQGGNSFGSPALLGTNDNQALTLRTNNSEKLRITADGNVGIGTAGPSNKFVVANNGGVAIQVFNLASSADAYYIANNSLGSSYFGINAVGSYIYNDSAIPISFYTNATERIRIAAGDGNVGIGTTGTSLGRLTVVGSITSAIPIVIDSNASYGEIQTYNSLPLYIQRQGNNTIMQSGGGNVGIGITSPNAALEVNGSIHFNANLRDAWGDNIWNISQYPYNNSTSPTYYMGFQVDTATRIFYISNKNNDGSATDPNGGIIFRTGVTPSNRMIVSYSGNVGIGTTSPTEHLSIEGSSDQSLSIYSTTTGVQGTARTFIKLFGTNTSTTKIEQVRIASAPGANASTAGQLIVSTNNSSNSLTERLRIDENGNVGIGTSSPGSKFEMYGGNMTIKMTGVTTGSIHFKNSSNTKIQEIRYDDSDGSLTLGGVGSYPIKFITSTTEKVRITGNGSVGIGTSSPSYPLQVYGETMVKGEHGTTRIQLYYPNGIKEREAYLTLWGSEPGISYNCSGIGGNVNIGGQYYGRQTNSSSYALYMRFDVNYGYTEFYASAGAAGTIGGQGSRVMYVDSTGILSTSGLRTYGASSLANNTTIDPDNYQNYVIAGGIADGSGWGVNTAIGGNAGLGDSWAIGHNGNALYMAMGNGSANDSFQTYVQFDPNRNLYLVPTSGNVGIGTSSPVQKLHVYGAVGNPATTGTAQNGMMRFSNTTDNAVLDIGMRGGGTGAWLQSTDKTSLAANYPLLLNPNGGSVGIGTTTVTNGQVVIYNTSGNTLSLQKSSGAAALMLGSDTTNYASIESIISGGVRFYTGNSTQTEKMRIDVDGNVGIGTSTINYKLEVYNSGAENVAKFRGPNDSTIIIGGSDAGGSGEQYITYQNVTTNTYAWMVGMDDGEDFRFAYGAAGEIHDGNTLVKIDQNGSVGIGTTSPVSNCRLTLQSSNTARFAITDGTVTSNIWPTGGILYFSTETNHPIAFITNANERLRIAADGNVGIGTTSPNYLTDIQSTTSPLTLNLKLNKTSTTNDYAEIAFQLWSGAGSGANTFGGAGTSRPSVVLRALNEDGGSAAGAFIVGTFTGGSNNSTLNERFRITSAGNVGIGTTSPSQILHITSTNSGNNGLTIATTSATGNPQVRFLNSAGTEKAAITYASSADAVYFYTAASGANILNFVGANVGIGTTSPSIKLHVVSTSEAARFEGSATWGTAIQITSTATGGRNYQIQSSANGAGEGAGKFLFVDKTSGATRIAIDSSGNVGIGTTDPIAKLHVSGSTMMMGDSGTFRPRQTIVGNVTGAASTTYKKIFACGHTSTGIINVTAIITSANTASATATFSFATAYGNPTVNRMVYVSLNSTITSVDCQYNNTGYQMEIAVTYTGATAPTLYFTAEGLGSQNWAY